MSQIAAAAVNLVTMWLPLESANDSLIVRRGAPIGGEYVERMILVEHDGTPDSREDSRFEQSWLDLACTRRMERGEIVCSIVVQTGDDDIGAAETTAFSLVNAAHALLGANPTLGGSVMTAQAASGTAQQLQNERGVAVVIPFTVVYSAVI